MASSHWQVGHLEPPLLERLHLVVERAGELGDRSVLIPDPGLLDHSVDVPVETWREQLGAHDLLRRRAGLAGVENGHPLLQDLDLVELMLRVPPELSFDRTFSRPLLCEAMAGLVPDMVRLRRDKAAFTQYYLDCMRGPDGDAIAELVTSPAAEIRRYVQPGVMEKRITGPMRRGEGIAWGGAVWRLATAELWLRSQA